MQVLENLWLQTKCISDLTTHSCWQGVFLPSTFSFMVWECTEWVFHCWWAKLLMVRSFSSPLKCTVNGLKQRGWFLRQCLNLEATQQPSFLCFKILCVSLSLPFCLVCSGCSLLSKPSFIKSQPCTWLSVQSSKPLNCSRLCLVLLLPVHRVSTKGDGRALSRKRKCYSGMSVGDCSSVGVLPVLFLQYLSQGSSCQTASTVSKTPAIKPMKSY